MVMYDGFLAKFNSSCQRQWGTYYGGSSDDGVSDIVTDANGTIYFSGSTTSYNAIATSGTHQPAKAGFGDAFIVCMNSSGVRQWGTYYGGTNGDNGTDATAMCLDNNGDILIVGITDAPNGLSSPNAHQTTHGGRRDGFLAKFTTSGSRVWGTYYGGSNFDNGYGVCTDNNNNVYLAGVTSSSSAIATSEDYQSSLGGGDDGFLANLIHPVQGNGVLTMAVLRKIE